MQRSNFFSLALSTLLFGCSSVEPGKGLNDVAALTSSRLDATLLWNGDEKASEEINAAVKKLLSQTLTVSDAVQIALLNSPAVQAVYEEVGIAQADLVQAGLLQNPTFMVERRLSGKALELDIAQNFMDLFFIPLRTKVAENALQSAKLKVADAIVKHAAETKEAFYVLQATLQMLEMRRAVSKALDASALAARKLFAAGNVRALECQNEQNLANEARLELALVENEVIQRRERLNVLLGLWGQRTTWKISDRLPDLSLQDPDGTGLERLAITQRLDLQSERNELDALGNSINLSGYGALITDATLGLHSEREPDGFTSRGPSFEFSIPIFNQGQPQRAKAYSEFRRQAAYFTQHVVEVRSEVRAAFSTMHAWRKRAEYYQRVVLPLQAQMLEQTQLQYNGMFMSVFQLLQAKRAQIQAAEGFIEAVREYWIARTHLELAVGGRISDVPLTPPPIVEIGAASVVPTSTPNHAHHH
jgi:cobalt-zinc-cadmium efflux system outer membrane protein